MSSIRAQGTAPEERMHEVLRSILGKRRRIDRNYRELPGTPDFFVPSLELAVFVHGCFWHCCPAHGQVPASNKSYWQPKLEANKRRDQRVRRKLNRLGLRVWRVWEHDLGRKRMDSTASRLAVRLEEL